MEEYIKLDSVGEVLVIETTIAKKMMTEESYFQSVQKLAKDIEQKNADTITKIKSLKKYQKNILSHSLYNWDYDSDYYGNNYVPSTTSTGMFGRLLRIVPKRDISRSEFQDLLKDIFGENALENCFYDRKVRGFAYKYKWTNNKLSVTVFSNLYLGNRHKEVELKAVFKHDKSNNTIKLCYIEKCNHSSLDYSIEAINSIKKYYHNALENEYQGPKITFNKQYESVIKKAVEKKYIDKTIVK